MRYYCCPRNCSFGIIQVAKETVIPKMEYMVCNIMRETRYSFHNSCGY